MPIIAGTFRTALACQSAVRRPSEPGRWAITRISYTDPKAPGSFGGIQYVRRYGGEVKNLFRNGAYTLHKSARVRFPRRKTYSKGPGDLFQIDLADLGSISSYNDGHRYLLT